MRFLPVLLALALLPAAALAQTECGEDLLIAEVDGATVHLTHGNAHYNCCSLVAFGIEAAPGDYLVTETESDQFCLCTCCFTLTARLDDVQPGQQTITLRFNDYDTNDWRELSTTVTVPDVGQGGDGTLASSWKSACGVTGVSDPAAGTWSALKRHYR
jgi:hypothetical protein